MRKALRRLARFAYRLVYMALLLLLLLTLASLGSRLLDPAQRLPGILGYSQLVVVSGSMQPAVSPGDLLVIRREKAYVPGDVVTFAEGNTLVTHRLVSVDGEQAITRGDANNAPDPPIGLSQIQGKMVLRVPALGHLALFLRSSQGLLTLTALMVVFIAVPLILKGSKETGTAGQKGGDAPHDT